jgi:isopentenyldiphosphate isomerase
MAAMSGQAARTVTISLVSQADEDELLDVLNSGGSPSGRQKPRGEMHRDGDWHRSFHLWIVKEGTCVLLQRRSKAKDLEPDKLDVSVGGHFRAGEGLKEVLREADEELGLTVHPKDLHFVETQRSECFYPGATDRQFQEVYALRCDQPLEDYVLNPQEVSVLYEAPLAGLDSSVSTERAVIWQSLALTPRGGTTTPCLSKTTSSAKVGRKRLGHWKRFKRGSRAKPEKSPSDLGSSIFDLQS